MAQGGVAIGQRVWFYDVRTPLRRMAIASHPDEGMIIVSFWQGDSCTGTFRLPVVDAARAIAAFADAMADGLPAPIS